MLALALVASATLIFSGCGFLAARPGGGGGDEKPRVQKIKVSVPFTASESVQPGTIFVPQPGGTVAVSNQVVKGTFSSSVKVDINLPKAKKGSAGASGGLKAASGTFISRLAGTFNPATGTGTFTGIKVIRFDRRKLGSACLEWSSTVTQTSPTSSTESATFRQRGGTRGAALGRFGGTSNATINQTGPSATASGTIAIEGKFGKPPKAPSADCKALAAQL